MIYEQTGQPKARKKGVDIAPPCLRELISIEKHKEAPPGCWHVFAFPPVHLIAKDSLQYFHSTPNTLIKPDLFPPRFAVCPSEYRQ